MAGSRWRRAVGLRCRPRARSRFPTSCNTENAAHVPCRAWRARCPQRTHCGGRYRSVRSQGRARSVARKSGLFMPASHSRKTGRWTFEGSLAKSAHTFSMAVTRVSAREPHWSGTVGEHTMERTHPSSSRQSVSGAPRCLVRSPVPCTAPSLGSARPAQRQPPVRTFQHAETPDVRTIEYEKPRS